MTRENDAAARQRRQNTAALILKCLQTLQRLIPQELNAYMKLDETIQKVLSDPLFMTQVKYTNFPISNTKNYFKNQMSVNASRVFQTKNIQNYFHNNLPNLQLNTSALILATTRDKLVSLGGMVDDLLANLFSIQDELHDSIVFQNKLPKLIGFGVSDPKNTFCEEKAGGTRGAAKKFICQTPVVAQISSAARQPGGRQPYFHGASNTTKEVISYLLLYSRLMRKEFRSFTAVRDDQIQQYNIEPGVALLRNLVTLTKAQRDQLKSNAPAWMTPYMIATEFAGNINGNRIKNFITTAKNHKIYTAQANRLMQMIKQVRESLKKKELDEREKSLLTKLLFSLSNEPTNNYNNVLRGLKEKEVKNILSSKNVLTLYTNQLPANLANANVNQKSMAKIVTLALKYMVSLGPELQKMSAKTHAPQRLALDVVQHLVRHANKTHRNVNTAKLVRITKMPDANYRRAITAKFSGNRLNTLIRVSGNQSISNDLQAMRDTSAIQVLQNKFRQAQNGQSPATFTRGRNKYTIENITR